MKKPKKILIICKKKYCLLTRSIHDHLLGHSIPVQIVHRDELTKQMTRGVDFIIITGGDGTFLQSSHYILKSTPVMGINPDPPTSYGFYTGKNHTDYMKKIHKVLQGKQKYTKLYRLKVTIGKRIVPLRVLNEVFYANQNPAQITYYRINGEMQMSSGVIISTASGSTAWSKSAGGMVLPITSDKFQFIVREPYVNKFPESKNFHQVMKKNQKVEIEDLMGDSFIAIDGTEVSYTLKKGQKLVVGVAKEALNIIL